MKNYKLNKIIFFCFLFVISFPAMADDIDNTNNDNGDVQDIPSAPIDDYIPLAFIAAVGLSLKFLRLKDTQIQ